MTEEIVDVLDSNIKDVRIGSYQDLETVLRRIELESLNRRTRTPERTASSPKNRRKEGRWARDNRSQPRESERRQRSNANRDSRQATSSRDNRNEQRQGRDNRQPTTSEGANRSQRQANPPRNQGRLDKEQKIRGLI